MPVVYACVCPAAPPASAPLTDEALARVAEELAAQRPDVLVVIARGAGMLPRAIGLLAEGTDDLAKHIMDEARGKLVPVERVRRWEPPPVLTRLHKASGRPSALAVLVSSLSLQLHFELGRAAGRALAADERRAVLVCAGRLSGAEDERQARLFDRQYREAIEAWHVKWAVHLDGAFRRRAKEDLAAQTAVLMGALSGLRIQPRVLSYEAPSGEGCLVAGVDVIGRRLGAPADTERRSRAIQ
jgi:hypothetical protein